MAEQDSNKRSSGRYGWVDVAKGICIVAVVCLYARREIVQAFVLDYPAGPKPEPVSRVTLRSAKGIFVHFTPRETTTA